MSTDAPDPQTTTTTTSEASTSEGSAESTGEDAWQILFDGELTDAWRMSTIVNQPGQDDPGHFDVEDGALVAVPGTDLGLLWHTEPTPADFELQLEWSRSAENDNSGVLVRFPDLDAHGYDNTAWVAFDFGFEVQIDETGAPDGEPIHTTGAIYGEPDQRLSPVPAAPVGEWNTYVIRVEGDHYTVDLNGERVTSFENPHPDRGRPSTDEAPAFIGLQTHTGAVRFRTIRLRPL